MIVFILMLFGIIVFYFRLTKKDRKEINNKQYKEEKTFEERITSKLESFNIRKTMVEITMFLADGTTKKFDHIVYGKMEQYVDHKYSYTSQPVVSDSLNEAKNFILNFKSEKSVVDDPYNPMKSITVTSSMVEIKETEDYYKEYFVYYVEYVEKVDSKE